MAAISEVANAICSFRPTRLDTCARCGAQRNSAGALGGAAHFRQAQFDWAARTMSTRPAAADAFAEGEPAIAARHNEIQTRKNVGLTNGRVR